MSLDASPLPSFYTAPCSLCIVASLFNEHYTTALVNNCLEELKKFAPAAKVNVVRVPGAYEIPVTASVIASAAAPPDLMIAFGVIIRGGTEHGDLIATSSITALQEIAVSARLPIINQILLVNTEEQAYERCMGDQLNRGREGAHATAAMLHVLAQLNTQYSLKNA